MFSPVLFKTANYNLHIHIIFQSLFNDIFPLKSSWFSEIGVNMFLKLNVNKHVHPFNYFELNFWNLNFSSKITCCFAYLACILLIHHMLRIVSFIFKLDNFLLIWETILNCIEPFLHKREFLIYLYMYLIKVIYNYP